MPIEMTTQPKPFRPTFGMAVLACICMVLAICTLRMHISLVWLRAAFRISDKIGRKQSNSEKVAQVVAAVRWAGQFYPGRAACLEVSLASRIAAVMLRQQATWCIGARFRPLQTHAWIEVDSVVVGEYAEVEGWRYKAAFCA